MDLGRVHRLLLKIVRQIQPLPTFLQEHPVRLQEQDQDLALVHNKHVRPIRLVVEPLTVLRVHNKAPRRDLPLKSLPLHHPPITGGLAAAAQRLPKVPIV